MSDTIFLLGSFLLSITLIIGGKPSQNTSQYTQRTIGVINQEFQRDLEVLDKASASFETLAREFADSNASKTSIIQEYRNLRTAFKKIEFIVEYLDKEAYDLMLNGAPLPKLEQKVSELVILEPKGLQVIDEIIGAETISEQKDDLFSLSTKLRDDIHQLYNYLKYRKISDRQFFEASRQTIIRLATLGITGFDTPGTLQGVEDASVILKQLNKYINLYKPELKNIHRLDLHKKLQKIVAIGVQQADTSTFNNFNRLSFIKEVINPLYKLIKTVHLSLDYETIYEVSKYPSAINYNSENLFEKDFLNEFYYVSIENDSLFNSAAELGKLLFYDPVFSQDNKMSCASCHVPEKAFAEGKRTSVSSKGKQLTRNSMTLNYSVFATGFFHDLRVHRLEDQFEHVILNEDEFNTNYSTIIKKLSSSQTYLKYFKKAFPDQNVSIKPNNIDYALVAYILKLNSFDNLVDLYFQETTTLLPENVERGFNLFTGKAACATCHFMPLYSGNVPPLFTDSETEVLGVPEAKDFPLILDDDLGRLGNGLPQETAPFYSNSFKTPTLRNIEKTTPYMHNGVFDTLEEVMDFYNEGGGAGRGMEIEHQTLASERLNLTEEEISSLIDFLKALNDDSVVIPPTSLPRDFEVKEINERPFIK